MMSHQKFYDVKILQKKKRNKDINMDKLIKEENKECK